VGLWFHEDRFGVFWLIYGSLGHIATLDCETNRLTRFDYEWKVGPRQENQAYSLLEDSNGTMWFGTAGAGLMKFDRQNRCFVSYRHDPADAETIGDNRVIALFEDREGNIWTGLHQAAPNHFPIRPLPFENLSHATRSNRYELSGQITAIYEGGRDEVWLGANRRLYHMNRKAREVLQFEGVDNSGYKHNRTDPTTLCSGVIYHLLIDRKGVLWSATWNGLCRFDPSDSRFTTYIPGPASRGLNYYAIAQGPDGALWLGGNLGLHRFDAQTKTFTVYSHNPEDPTSIS